MFFQAKQIKSILFFVLRMFQKHFYDYGWVEVGRGGGRGALSKGNDAYNGLILKIFYNCTLYINCQYNLIHGKAVKRVLFMMPIVSIISGIPLIM